MSRSAPDSDRFVAPLPCEKLRWRCEPSVFRFQTTNDVEPIEGVAGQDTAIEALRFGLEVGAPGQNIFVRGLTGTGRSTMVKRLVESIRPGTPRAPDRLYVHNFDELDRPHLLTLRRGTGRAFRNRVEEFVRFIREDLKGTLTSEGVKGRGATIERETAERAEALGRPFDKELREAGLTLVQVQLGPARKPMIAPLFDGEPASSEDIERRKREGKITEEEIEALKKKIGEFSQRLEELGEKIQDIQIQGREAYRKFLQQEARSALEGVARPIRKEYGDPGVGAYLDEVVEDVVVRHLHELEGDLAFTRFYGVNLIQAHDHEQHAPVVIENAPSVQTLVGTVDVLAGRTIGDGETVVPHMMVRGGSILHADGGYLILDARDLISEPGAWRALIRTLRGGCLDMVPPDLPVPWRVPVVKPDPIPVHVKVVLLGDAYIYYMLDGVDADFPHYFKVLADFDSVIERSDEALHYYAGALARLCRDENLLPFEPSAVAKLCEHGARVAAQPGKLTMRLGRLADIARESSYLATQSGQGTVIAEHVSDAVRRTKHRADLPARRYRERIADGTIRIGTRGKRIGQINGLAVISAGPLTYGFPQRITATIGPGTAGAINIEREAELSGAIHNKGFYILGGLLRSLLRTDHPLAFEASVAFEQSYGGIDGDSASGAEMCCLLSALTEVPLRQDLAMTGAIDQIGNLLPIGAVNEKIEGFFDTCHDDDGGLTGTQGVLIPSQNVGDLMLREDVVKTCSEGLFHVYPVDTIHEALGLFTGIEAGGRDDRGRYPADSLLGRAVEQARLYWKEAVRTASPSDDED